MFARRSIGSALLPVCLLWSSVALGNTAWHPIDGEELERVRADTPRAAELLERADDELRAGELSGAEKLLSEARTLAPASWLIGRRHCQVLTELGRRAEAMEACKVALLRSTAMDSRALVGALMASPDPATPRQLIQAVREAVAARRLQQQPFSDAALCEIAHHIGDEAMLNLCVESLQRVAPHNFETARWQGVRRQSPAWALWLGWLTIVAALAATCAHAVWRWLRAPSKARNAAIAAVTSFVVLSVTGSARAQAPGGLPEVQSVPAGQPLPVGTKWQLSRFPINHENPESFIPSIEDRNKDPLEFGYFLQDLNTEAMKAERNGDYRSALKYWRAAATAVPDMAVAFGKICRAHQMLGERERAIEFCSKALNMQGATQEDYLRMGELITQKPAALAPLEVQDLDAIVSHLRTLQGQEGPAAVIECRVGVKLDDAVRLQRCTQVLGKLSPKDPRTMTFLWSYAMLRKDFGEAKRLLAAMEKSSMPPQAVAQVKAATAKASAWWRRPFTDWRYGLAASSILVLGAGGLVLLRRRMAAVDPGLGAGPATAT